MEQRLQEEQFWQHCWQTSQTKWHLDKPHTALVEFIELIAPRPMKEISGGRATTTVFVPLCGASLDIHWLRDQGYNVIGCELSAEALKQMFAELKVKPSIHKERTSTANEVEVWETEHIKIYHANFFNLGELQVDAVFDRAALVALPDNTRLEYTQHMLKITNAAPQLLIAFEHNRDTAPPYSVPLDLVRNYYAAHYNIEVLSHRATSGSIIENSYLLTK